MHYVPLNLANYVAILAIYTKTAPSPTAALPSFFAHVSTNPDTGASLEYLQLMFKPDK